MKQGIILINAYSDHPGEMHRVKRLKEEFSKLGVEINVVRNGPAAYSAAGDFCVFLDKDKYCALKMEKTMRLFDSARAIEVCDDKMLTYLAFEGKVPMPKSIPSLLCYTPKAEVPQEFIEKIEKELKFPVVVKECFGSLGKQVYLAKDRGELLALSKRLQAVPHLFQEYVESSAGRDLRVISVGGKPLGAMVRTSECGDFRSNAELGGRGDNFPINCEIEWFCEKVYEKLQIDYCGIDLLWGREGGMLLCEVNSNAFFQKFEEVTKINVAEAYARYICKEIYCEI